MTTAYFSSARNQISRLLILTTLICLRHEGSSSFSAKVKFLLPLSHLPRCQKEQDSKEFCDRLKDLLARSCLPAYNRPKSAGSS